MEQKELMECVERIEGHNKETYRGLDGIILLQEQITGILREMDNSKDDNERIAGLDDYLSKLMAELDLVWITLDHVRKHNDFTLQDITEIKTDGFRDLSAFPRG
jgi:hypothetical protein